MKTRKELFFFLHTDSGKPVGIFRVLSESQRSVVVVVVGNDGDKNNTKKRKTRR